MCFYEQTLFGCNHTIWGDLRKECNRTVDGACGVKEVYSESPQWRDSDLVERDRSYKYPRRLANGYQSRRHFSMESECELCKATNLMFRRGYENAFEREIRERREDVKLMDAIDRLDRKISSDLTVGENPVQHRPVFSMDHSSMLDCEAQGLEAEIAPQVATQSAITTAYSTSSRSVELRTWDRMNLGNPPTEEEKAESLLRHTQRLTSLKRKRDLRLKVMKEACVKFESDEKISDLVALWSRVRRDLSEEYRMNLQNHLHEKLKKLDIIFTDRSSRATLLRFLAGDIKFVVQELNVVCLLLQRTEGNVEKATRARESGLTETVSEQMMEHLCQRMGVSLRLVEHLCQQMEESLRQRMEENLKERLEALAEETEGKKQSWHTMPMDTPQQRRERHAQELSAKVLACMPLLGGTVGPPESGGSHTKDTYANFHTQQSGQKISSELLESVRIDPNFPRKELSGDETLWGLASASPLYTCLDLSFREIRLLELRNDTEASIIEASICTVPMEACPPYTAVSYTWGDAMGQKVIKLNDNKISIRENLWRFLHNMRSSQAGKRRFFWIDALCIDQGNVHERNHQVKMMKEIYQEATDIVVWLGKEKDNSDIAMDYISSKGLNPLKRKKNGYHQIWTDEQGKAVLALCERSYWRRIWIVQEVIHARNIIVSCGRKTFRWQALENVYHNLKTVESEGWQRHHKFSAQILDSVACTMVWQRAHWRHPDTPTPTLVELVRVFRDWQAGDIRDKVNALNGLVDPSTSIVIEYKSSTQQVFEAVRDAAEEWEARDDTLLREVLGIPYPQFRHEKLPLI